MHSNCVAAATAKRGNCDAQQQQLRLAKSAGKEHRRKSDLPSDIARNIRQQQRIQNRPKIELESIQIRARISPESIQNLPRTFGPGGPPGAIAEVLGERFNGDLEAMLGATRGYSNRLRVVCTPTASQQQLRAKRGNCDA